MDLQSRITTLEQLLESEMAAVAMTFNEMYVNCVPILLDERRKFAQKLANYSDMTSLNFANLEAVVEKENEQPVQFKQQNKIDELRRSKNFLELIAETETLLVKAYAGEEKFDVWAQSLQNVKSQLEILSECAPYTELQSTIAECLWKEYNSQYQLLSYQMSQFFRGVLAFPEQVDKDIVVMRLCISDHAMATSNLCAMNIFGQLDTCLQHMADNIVSKLCAAIIQIRGNSNFIKITKILQREAVFSINLKAPKNTDIDPSQIFQALLNVFKLLHDVLRTIFLTDQSLMRSLGQKLENPLMSLILKDVISVALPSGIDEQKADSMLVMEAAEDFRMQLIELDIFNEATPKFEQFCSSNSKIFIDRRCLTILTTARELISQPFKVFVEVGSDDDTHSTETVQELEFAGLKPISDIYRLDESMPSLLRLTKCKISDSAVKFIQLVEENLKEAYTNPDEAISQRLALTVRNIVQLYQLTAYRQHHAAITTVPQQAAVFFNNCYYIAHRLMLFPFLNLGEKRVSAFHRVLLTENVPQFRTIAADALEDMLASCRRNLSAELSDPRLFASSNPVRDNVRDARVQKTLNCCFAQIKIISDAFREVLAERIYISSMKSLTLFFLEEITRIILSMEDIYERDAVASADELDMVMKKLEPLFECPNSTAQQNFNGHFVFRTREIALCLRGSLHSIETRWCDGKGPLAEFLKRAEVRNLVKALFANTDHRKALLGKLG